MGPTEEVTAPSLVIRVDGNSHIGAGHVMRCLALAEAAHVAGVTPIFVMAQPAEALVRRLHDRGMEVVYNHSEPGSTGDAVETAAVVLQRKAPWLVVDGYHFETRFLHAVKQASVRLLCIDDYCHTGYQCADIILNQNGYADEALYPKRAATTRLLLGSQYVLLRQEFWPWRATARQIKRKASKVLVTLGGGDFHNVTLRVLDALQQVPADSIECKVVVGGSNPHFAELQKVVEQRPSTYCLLQDVSNMPDLMAWADIAISAAGTTGWELAFMGLPALLIVLADNQEPVAHYVSSIGSAQNVGSHTQLAADTLADEIQALRNSYERRLEMSRRGRNLVDGYGAQRVLASMFS